MVFHSDRASTYRPMRCIPLFTVTKSLLPSQTGAYWTSLDYNGLSVSMDVGPRNRFRANTLVMLARAPCLVPRVIVPDHRAQPVLIELVDEPMGHGTVVKAIIPLAIAVAVQRILRNEDLAACVLVEV
mmetsp:Transcript_60840/g.117245  ORF Transcript_60840/g.117245 Transcript_60840/m.117245 type:complete len:128 (-) Transcript_60840:226-609(-)